jgi:hypothetical protein
MTGGYLYVLWNPIYETYGQNKGETPFKLGETPIAPLFIIDLKGGYGGLPEFER